MHDSLAQLARHTAPRGRQAVDRSVAALARPVTAVGSSMPVGQLEVLFRSPDVSCVAVLDDADPARVGIVTRPGLAAELTGRLGYGRAVLERRPVSAVADWSPLVVPADATLSDVATRAMTRPDPRRYDDVLVRGAHWAAASTADLMRSLVAALADRGTHDPLTGVPGRSATWRAFSRRCALVAQSGRAARAALVLVDVVGMTDVNARHGLGVGDAVLAELGARLAGSVPSGCEVGRVDGDRFAVLATFAVADDLSAAASVDALRQDVLARLAPAPATVPPGAWPALRAVATCSVAGAADPDELVRDAERRLRATGPRAWG